VGGVGEWGELGELGETGGACLARWPTTDDSSVMRRVGTPDLGDGQVAVAVAVDGRSRKLVMDG
jgi:hypothetical protein